MSKVELPLTSDQMELLLAFEASKGLTQLSKQMQRDPSVVSRSLQRLADRYAVVEKIKGRWEITNLGKQVNNETKVFYSTLNTLLAKGKSENSNIEAFTSPLATLMVLNAQKALWDPRPENRNNEDAEVKISRLLKLWRKSRKPIVHVRHIMDDIGAPFHPKSQGYEFIPDLSPLSGEAVFDKWHASAFSQTQIQDFLQDQGITTLILVGFTGNECIDATARQAGALGFNTYVVQDATAVFDLSGPDGRLIKAERIHKLTMANLSAFFATVIETEKLLSNE